MELVIRPGGAVRCVYSEAIDLQALGPLHITRASTVEPDAQGCWWADLAPVQGPLLGPFAQRQQALDAEQQWLSRHWLMAPCSPAGRSLPRPCSSILGRRRGWGQAASPRSIRAPLPAGAAVPNIALAGAQPGEKPVKVTIENGELVIRLPLNRTPVPSSSGKTLVVASTHGNQKTEAVIQGQPVILGVNAYIARPPR